MDVDVHPLSSNPTEAWAQLSKTQRVIKVTTRPASGPAPGKARIVVMSDTHSLTHHIKFDIPDGDIFIHAGDFTKCGGKSEVLEFNSWIGNLPHKHKLVIAGNHELSFDPTFTHPFKTAAAAGGCPKKTTGTPLDDIPTLGNSKDSLVAAVRSGVEENMKELLTNCTYLEDESIEILGLKIYGSPWQPEFCKWAFNLPRGKACLEKWNQIPENIDILITHTPPLGFGDFCLSGQRAGCVDLLMSVQRRIKPKYHVFGHVHEGYGITTDGKIIFVNASTCDLNYLPNNPPIVFDVTLSPDIVKS